jgi:hypothetical protein
MILTFWSFTILDRDYRLAGLHCPRPKALFMVLGTHRDEPTARDVEDQVVFRRKSDQGILGFAVLWARGIEKIYSNGSRIRRRLRAWQEDLATECDRLLMSNELNLMNKLSDQARG